MPVKFEQNRIVQTTKKQCFFTIIFKRVDAILEDVSVAKIIF